MDYYPCVPYPVDLGAYQLPRILLRHVPTQVIHVQAYRKNITHCASLSVF